MGDAEEVVLFIRECLHMDAVLEVSDAFICQVRQTLCSFLVTYLPFATVFRSLRRWRVPPL